jgi:hypothetical protein
MFAFDGETLTLRPEGFALDIPAIEAHLAAIPGSFRRAADGPWTLVVPASDAPRIQAWKQGDPIPRDAHYALVSVAPDRIEIYPGWDPIAWGRAQRFLDWLFQLGPWRVSSETREIGLVRSLDQLYAERWLDADLPEDPTESPPRAGELTTFRRYLGDVDGEYLHDLVRAHSSGAFSYEEASNLGSRRWEGRLEPGLAARWTELVARLDFGQSSPGLEELYIDRTAIRVERPGSLREKVLDAEHPPASFAEIVRLMSAWAAALQTGARPEGLIHVRRVAADGRS